MTADAVAGMAESDKTFWHGFIEFYEAELSGKVIQRIAEFGIFKGNSIRWLLQRFPGASIDAVDILPVQQEWPRDPRVTYHRIDQGRADLIKNFFSTRTFDLIIEDGSHVPEHQVTCLAHGFPSVAGGGYYFLEDIHTSHPTHEVFRSKLLRRFRSRSPGTALSTLLAIDHLRRLGRVIGPTDALHLSNQNMLTQAEIEMISASLKSIRLYRRSHLPNRCFRCGSEDFDYHIYKCKCGVELFAHADSMSFSLGKLD